MSHQLIHLVDLCDSSALDCHLASDMDDDKEMGGGKNYLALQNIQR